MNKREQAEYDALVAHLDKYMKDRAELCEKIERLEKLLRDVLGVFAGDFEINPRDVRERIAAALKKGE